MLWSKNHLLLPNCMPMFFLQHHNIKIKNQSKPGVHAAFPVGGAWTHSEGHAMQSLFSENVYKNERVGSYRGVCAGKLCYICQYMTPTRQQEEISLKQCTDIN